MNRFLAGLALVLASVLVLGPPTAQPAQAAGPSRFCYNWDFLNNTGVDATGLLAQFGGIQAVSEVYTGAWNPFGAPASSSYSAAADTYTLSFDGGPAYAGDTIHVGFCTDAPALQRPTTGNAPSLAWQTEAGRVTPDPLLVGIRWTWTGPSRAQVELFNEGPVDVVLMEVNLLDPGEPLVLEDLAPSVVGGLPVIEQLITEPQLLGVGVPTVASQALMPHGAATVAGSTAIAAQEGGRPVVLEVLFAANDDPSNVGHLYVQTLTPFMVYLPVLFR